MEVTARNSNRAAKTKIYFKQFNISQSPPNHQFGYQKKNYKIQLKKKKKKKEKLRTPVTKFQVLFFFDTFSKQPNRTYK
jgi:hypothetical protein